MKPKPTWKFKDAPKAEAPEADETREASPIPEVLDPPEAEPAEMDFPPPGPPADDPEARHNEMLDRYQRCLAEFDNYRKRTAKEMAARYDDGVRAACEKLLPIVDNFERAMAANENNESTFYQGIALIARQLDNTLGELGIKPIATEPGEPFDTNIHYAVAHTEDESLGQNVVAEVLQKGFAHKDKVLRYSMVRVAN